MGTIVDFLKSGWVFFFRWPVFKAQEWNPLGLILGPLWQSLAWLVIQIPLLALWKLLHTSDRYMSPLMLFVPVALLSAWTGFFHEDGLADSADSLGVSRMDNSPATLDRIRAALKDSRLGSFGVCALCILWISRWNMSSSYINMPWVIGVNILMSRTAGLLSARALCMVLPAAQEGHSSHMMHKIEPLPAAFSWFLQYLFASIVAYICLKFMGITGIALFVSMAGLVAIPFLAALFFILSLTQRSAFLGGDFIGGGICFAEMLGGFVWILVAS